MGLVSKVPSGKAASRIQSGILQIRELTREPEVGSLPVNGSGCEAILQR